MTNSFSHPWIAVILGQFWILRHSTELVTRSIDPRSLLGLQTPIDHGLKPRKERQNPLEFHGKLRVPTPQRLRSAQTWPQMPLPRSRNECRD